MPESAGVSTHRVRGVWCPLRYLRSQSGQFGSYGVHALGEALGGLTFGVQRGREVIVELGDAVWIGHVVAPLRGLWRTRMVLSTEALTDAR